MGPPTTLAGWPKVDVFTTHALRSLAGRAQSA